jgi:serine/threonine protein kinase
MVESKGSKIKYIDFGLAVDKNSSLSQSPGGTISFFAPELWSYTPKTLLDFQLGDIFALGATIYELITGFSRIQIWVTEKQNLSYIKYFSDYVYPDKSGKTLQTLDETFIKDTNLVMSNLSGDARFEIIAMISKIPVARKLPLV